MGKYVSKCKVITYHGKTWGVNANPSGIYTEQMKRIIEQLENMLSYHRKLLVIRFDLHQPIYTANNEQITAFQRRFFRWIKRKYKVTRIGFMWAREIEKSKAQHYHYALILDGSKVNTSASVIRHARDYWQRMSGTEWTPKECHFYKFNREDTFTLRETIYRLSYLAKGRGKGYKAKQAKDYSTSRIKLKGQ